MAEIYLPEKTRNRAKNLDNACLQLDKYCPIEVGGGEESGQQAQKAAIEKVAAIKGDEGLLDAFRKRHEALWAAAGATAFSARSSGPFTLHLSRAGALENAGICLHPVYGFAYVPGSGLKGMARAFAETVWLKQQADAKAAQQKIETVFGNRPGEPRKDKQRAGAVVFHDALPETWPKLFVDILNNHHSKYYQGDDDRDPPGDWENPIPVYFLAIKNDTRFRFALSPRPGAASAEGGESPVALAAQWLMGALENFGAGAKTNAGYGRFGKFEPVALPGAENAVAPKKAVEAARDGARKVWRGAIGGVEGIKPSRAEFKATLELVTPAFLAGANQKKEDCDLRPATLRGLLRWWWRTMHAGYLPVGKLRELEALIWGDTKRAGAVKVNLQAAPLPVPKVSEFKFKDINKKDNKPKSRPNSTFIQRYNLGQPASPIAGMYYLSFGMDDIHKDKNTQKEERVSRWYVEPPASWNLRLTVSVRDGIAANDLLDEARRALWLLTRFGGVGAKSRKGFGCLKMTAAVDADTTPWGSIKGVKEAASSFRSKVNLGGQSSASVPENATLQHAICHDDIKVNAENFWQAIEKVGAEYNNLIKSIQPKEDRAVFGLPRGTLKSDRPRKKDEKADRHAAPVVLHLEPFDNDSWRLTVLAMPQRWPRDPQRAQLVLTQKLNEFCNRFDRLPTQAEIKARLEDERREREAREAEERRRREAHEREKAEGKGIGVITAKPTTKNAEVRLDDGREVTAGGAKKYEIKQRVCVARGPDGNWRIEGPA